MTGRASRRLRLSSSPARVRPWTKPASQAVGPASAPPRYDVVSPPNALSRPLPSLLPTNYILRNDDRSRHQESERHRVIVWGMHAEQAARLLRKGSKVPGAGPHDLSNLEGQADQCHTLRRGDRRPDPGLLGRERGGRGQAEQPALAAPAPQPAEPVAAAKPPAKPKRSRSKQAQAAAV